MNQPVEAEKYFQNGLQYGPHNPAPYFFYARWLKGQGRIDEALKLLKKAHNQISPSYNPAQSLLSEILANPKGFKTPLEQAEELTKANPTPENYLNLSLQYHRVQRFEDSIDACKKALKIKPDYFLAYNNICAAYNEVKMWDRAIEACERGLKINPDLQLLKNNLARAKSQKALQK